MPATPAYRRVAADLRRRIDAKEFAPGDRLPSRAQLATEYSTSDRVIQDAILRLRMDGILAGAQRSRPTVAHRPTVSILSDPDDAWPYSETPPEHHAVAATRDLAARLGVDEGHPLLLARSERLDQDGRPSHLRCRYTVAHQTGRPSRRVVRMAARHAESDEAHLLGIATGALLLLVQSTWFSPKDVPVEAIDLLLPADRWHADSGW